jgi:hypothetical protein
MVLIPLCGEKVQRWAESTVTKVQNRWFVHTRSITGARCHGETFQYTVSAFHSIEEVTILLR